MTEGTATDGRDAREAVLILGGAGFVGCNLAEHLLQRGEPVRILDNLSRPGTERNLRWLTERHGDRLQFDFADIRDRRALEGAVERASFVFHFAAQVAVTYSLANPLYDHAVNVTGTLNVLEAIRNSRRRPPLVYTSTNKVYGGLDDIALRLAGERYEPEDPVLRARGVDETRPLSFSSPYGCSKGAADQYVLDYAHSYGVQTVVLRMSCIYGPHQLGTEDQGWVAHFIRRALAGEPITLYGDGCQVRDVLHVDDLVRALMAVRARIGALGGRAYNIGGGADNALSLRELVRMLAEWHGREPNVNKGAWRTADQRYYVSDFGRLHDATGWRPEIPAREGVRRFYGWLEHQGRGAAMAQQTPVLRGKALR